MLEKLFDGKLQGDMVNFFLNELAPKGKHKSYSSGSIIDYESSSNIYIVLEGLVAQELISEDGKTISLFMLPPGTIFGEMDYFEGAKACQITQSMSKNTKISVINQSTLESEMAENPQIYRYLLHSITRKFRILMLKLADNSFNDFKGKLASTLVRFAIMEEGRLFNGAKIKNIKSITSFSKYLNCSRSTLSVTLSEFKEQGIIEMNKSEVTILDKDSLESFINFVW